MPLPHSPPPVARPKKPKLATPQGAVDCHVHVLASKKEYAFYDKRREDPAPGLDIDGWLALLDTHLETLGMDRVVVIQSILLGTDNRVALEAIKRLGSRARGIGLLTDSAGEAELDPLLAGGIRGLRLNLVQGGTMTWKGVRRLTPAMQERGMHFEVLMHAHKHMGRLAELVSGSPVPVVFDHIGWPNVVAMRGEPGFRLLCNLMAKGHAWVKLSGIYRMCHPPYDLADDLVEALVESNPERCLWGSDWPHIMLGDAKQPDAGKLLDAFNRVVTNDAVRQQILVDNPVALYGF